MDWYVEIWKTGELVKQFEVFVKKCDVICTDDENIVFVNQETCYVDRAAFVVMSIITISRGRVIDLRCSLLNYWFIIFVNLIRSRVQQFNQFARSLMNFSLVHHYYREAGAIAKDCSSVKCRRSIFKMFHFDWNSVRFFIGCCRTMHYELNFLKCFNIFWFFLLAKCVFFLLTNWNNVKNVVKKQMDTRWKISVWLLQWYQLRSLIPNRNLQCIALLIPLQLLCIVTSFAKNEICWFLHSSPWLYIYFCIKYVEWDLKWIPVWFLFCNCKVVG